MKFFLSLTASLALLSQGLAAPTKGTYCGLFFQDDEIAQQSSGSLTITTTAKGNFSGSIQINGSRASLKSTFDATGKASVEVKMRNLNPLHLELQLDQSAAAEVVSGTVSDGTWTAQFAAHRAAYDGKASLAPQSGNYTVIIPDRYHSATIPGGFGNGTVSVSKAGKVKLTGTLADGTKISQGSTISQGGLWPFYLSLYAGKGCAISWITFSKESLTDLHGTFTWMKAAGAKSKSYPAGFSNETEVLGSAYHAPASGTRVLSFETGDVTLGGGNLENIVNNHVTVDGKNRVKNLSVNKLSLTLSPTKGTFRGKVTAPGGSKPISFGGVVMQSFDSGGGCFSGANQSGFVQFRAAVADVVKFQTLGSSFAPVVEFAAKPDSFAWAWSDGTISSNYPSASKSFGSVSARDQYLNVYPPGLLTGINIGFDGSDGATNAPIAYCTNQNVGDVYFSYPLTGLRYWASSYNPITRLDFTGFVSLEDVECFHCTNLQQVAVANLPSVRRLCFESCDLQELDLSGNPSLEDVRAAINGPNAFSEIAIGGGTGPKIWHFCVRDNPQITQDLQTIMTNFYSLQEPWFWNANQSGALKFVSTNLTDVEIYDNHYTSADFNGQSNLQFLWAEKNNFTNLVLTGCVSLLELRAQDNELPRDVLDNLLSLLDTSCPNLQFVDLHNNAQTPSAAGYSHADSLMNRGVTVYLDP